MSRTNPKNPRTPEQLAKARERHAQRKQEAAAIFASQPDDGLAKIHTVCAIFSCSTATAWRWVKSSKLPKPHKIGRTTVWRVADLRAALAKVGNND